MKISTRCDTQAAYEAVCEEACEDACDSGYAEATPSSWKIQVSELGIKDVLVVKLSVGNMPPQRVNEYTQKCRESLQSTFGADQLILILPERGMQSTELSIIKRV